MVTLASAILKEWASQRAALWGNKTMTFKTHQALHLAEKVLQHGPLSTHSAFSGESAIGRIGKNISCYSMEISVKQICERMDLEYASLDWIETHCKADVKQMFKLIPTNPKRRTQKPSEEVENFLNLQDPEYLLHGEISILGFSLCPYWKTGSADCYVAVKTANGYEPLKIMAIIEKATKEIFFCCKVLNTRPYSSLMSPEGILTNQPLVYQYCRYGKKENFENDGYILCNAQCFLAKYAKIEIEECCYLLTVPHAFEHN
uniref:YqaJ viral recombinase domain-containing protein n=1 Tax=Panagrolaimus superbus TaxID=310955 RepID=A0A914ZDA9_9BILA